jgi:hypothetical protein
MHAFNSEGTYVLFETGSPEPTRTWSREVYNCERRCTNCPITRDIPSIPAIPYAEKLKYVVLKNPPSTAPPKQAGWVSTQNTILLNNVLYKVDPLVFPYLAVYNIQTCADLQRAIAEIRRVNNLQVPIGVKLAPVPLVQKVVKRVYLAGNDTKPGNYISEAFAYPYKLSPYTGDTQDVVDAVKSLRLYAFLVTGDAKVFSATTNDKCRFTSKVIDFYDVASVWGKHILPITAIKLYKETNERSFPIIWVVLTPPSPRIYNGILINYVGVLVGINGHVVFVPTYTPTEKYNPVPDVNMAVLISSINADLFATRVKQLAINVSVHYKLLEDATNVVFTTYPPPPSP